MPIYEYQCATCHHATDLIQKVNDPDTTTCPACGKESLVRLVSAAGFQLKGTGWYATDFKTDKNKKASAATSSTPATVETAKPIASESTSK